MGGRPRGRVPARYRRFGAGGTRDARPRSLPRGGSDRGTLRSGMGPGYRLALAALLLAMSEATVVTVRIPRLASKKMFVGLSGTAVAGSPPLRKGRVFVCSVWMM